MFSRRASRQGSESEGVVDGVDWDAVRDMVSLLQSKQTLSKDTLAGFKKSLKSPSKSHVCKTLTTLDSIAANCSSSMRSQLADTRWIEMLISVCYKNPTAALPTCQLLSNWICSYSHEQLGQAAKFAAQAVRQKGYAIPPPAPLAHHMAEVAQQGTPMIGFQRGFDFTTVDLMPAPESSGSMASRPGSGPSRHGSQSSQRFVQPQVGGNMAQKLQAMQQGVQQLREVTQICQSVIDAGPAGGESVASQHSQRGWHLAKKCNGWANEVQVMVACEPTDSVLAALLQTNDDLLAAVSNWESTASRLVMQESQSMTAASASALSQSSASSAHAASATPEVSDSSTSSTADLYPSPAASGGLFWSSTTAAAPMQLPPASAQQPPQQHHQQPQQQLYPQIHTGSVSTEQGRGSAARQDLDLGQLAGNGNYLNSLAGLQPQYPHQLPAPGSHSQSPNAAWQGFGAGAGMLAALPSEPAATDARQSGRVNAPHEFHGSVLSYRLAEPQQAEAPLQQPEGTAPWLDGQAEASSTEELAHEQPFDPFGATQSNGQWQASTPDSPFRTISAAGSPFEPAPSAGQVMPSGMNAPEAPPLINASHSGTNSQAASSGTERVYPAPTPSSYPTSTPHQLPAGLLSNEGALSSRAASNHSMGSRTPSIPLAHSGSSHSVGSLPAAKNSSGQSLASMVSESIALQKGRSPSPSLGLKQDAFAQSSNQGFLPASAGGLTGVEQGLGPQVMEAEQGGEAQQLRQQLQQRQAQYDAEMERMNEKHAAHVAGIQAQAVDKMKELIEKVKEQTLKERGEAELRLQEAHQAEQNALLQLQTMRRDCRQKDGVIADLHRKLGQTSSPSASNQQSHDVESNQEAVAQRRASSEGPDATALEHSPFGGIPRPRSASSTQQLPSAAPAAKRGRMQRAGSNLDKGAASANGLQAYYRQPALRVRFTPGQLEELSQGTAGPSHKEWAAQLKLPRMDRRTSS